MAIVKMYEIKNELFAFNLMFRLGIRVSSVVKVRVRFQIRFWDFVTVPASDYSEELLPKQDS